MERIGKEVQSELARFGATPAGGMAEIVAAWPGVVGDSIAANAWPTRVARDGTLHVSVSSSPWAFELAQLEPEIAARLAHTLGEPAPRRLRFAPGPLPEPSTQNVRKEERVSPRPSAEDLATAAKIAAQATDSDLRELISRAAAASLARASSDRPL
jgi:hypothetical protein